MRKSIKTMEPSNGLVNFVVNITTEDIYGDYDEIFSTLQTLGATILGMNVNHRMVREGDGGVMHTTVDEYVVEASVSTDNFMEDYQGLVGQGWEV